MGGHRDAPTPDERDSNRLVFLCLASLTVALLLLQLARLSGGAVLRIHWFGIGHVVWTPHHWLRLTLIISMLLFGIMTFGIARCRHLGSAKSVRLWMGDGREPIIWFFLGILGGAIVRFIIGNSNITGFTDGSAPIVAALLVAVLVPVNDKKVFSPAQQIAVMYLLIAAVAAAIGSYEATSGWIYGLAFELILGGIATSIWLVWNILPSSPLG